jgi:hypothetical protein
VGNPYRYFCNEGFSPDVKLGVAHYPPSSGGIENHEPLPPIPPHVFVANCITSGAAVLPNAEKLWIIVSLIIIIFISPAFYLPDILSLLINGS